MNATFSFYGLTGYRYGLCVASAWLLWLLLVGLLRVDRRLPKGTTRVYATLSFPLALLLGRLEYCLVNWRLFTETLEAPAAMLRFWEGGFGMAGALLGLIAAAFITSRIQDCRFGRLLDIACVPMGLLIAGERFAERFTALGVGKMVESGPFVDAHPWLFVHEQVGAMDIASMAVYRYEAILGAFLTLVMLALYVGRHKKRPARPGDLALVFFALYGASQVVMESLRNDGHLLLLFFRVGQLCAVVMPVAAMVIFTRRAVRIHGVRAGQVVCWAGTLLCIGLLVALEFSIDGRLDVPFSLFGLTGLGRDYAVMSFACLLLFLFPYVQWRRLKNVLYRNDHIGVRLRREPKELPL